MKTTRMNIVEKLVMTLVTGTIIISAGAFIEPAPADKTIRLTFADHLQAGLIEQDVYVERVPSSDEVFRVLPEEREKYPDALV